MGRKGESRHVRFFRAALRDAPVGNVAMGVAFDQSMAVSFSDLGEHAPRVYSGASHPEFLRVRKMFPQQAKAPLDNIVVGLLHGGDID